MNKQRLALLLCLLTASYMGAVTIPVNSTGDAGPGSLRAAIDAINTAGDPTNTITFNLGTNPPAIILMTPLAVIQVPVTIDGGGTANMNPINQPNNAVILVELAGQLVAGNGLEFGPGSAGSIVRGLCINNFQGGSAIVVGAENITVEGCFLGTSRDGLTSIPNGNALSVLAEGATIGGALNAARNLIAGQLNGFLGGVIEVLNSGITVQGNTVGIDALGDTSFQSGLVGISTRLNDEIVRITQNVVSGHSVANISVDALALPIEITTNLVGTDISGDLALMGNGRGITIGGRADGAENPVDVVIADNTVSGNTFGITLGSNVNGLLAVNGVQILRNKIGVNLAGEQTIANSEDGIWLEFSSNSFVNDNIIGGNAKNGIRTSNSTNADITNNFVGRNSGNDPLPNGSNGIQLGSLSAAGPTTSGTRVTFNTVEGNQGNGIAIVGCARNLTILSNTIGFNAENGIFVGPRAENICIGGLAAQPNVCIVSPQIDFNTGTFGTGNFIFSNTLNGIALDGACATKIQTNRIEANQKNGISVRRSKNTLIGASACGPMTPLGNLITLNAEYGVCVDRCSSRTTILSNTIVNNVEGPIKRTSKSKLF